MRVYIGLFGLLVATPAMAQTLPGNVEEGRNLALQLCSACHVVAPGQRPIHPGVAAPSFATIARDPATTEPNLRNFLRSPHPIMPMLILSQDETDDVISYILSLKQR